jgi:nicotinamide phosphoribosyltransferase
MALTRDTLGYAIKATYGVINGVPVQVYKEPKTDTKKKSAKGLFRVEQDEKGELYLVDGLDSDEGGIMQTVFEDGKMMNLVTFQEIRDRLAGAKQ